MSKDNIEFSSVKVLDKLVELKWKEGKDNKTMENTKDRPEQSFVSALNTMKKELAPFYYIPEDKIEKITITGFSLSGQEENLAVVIKGKLETPAGKSANLISPAIMLEQDQYQFEEKLLSDIGQINIEARRYAFEYKRVQTSLESDPNFNAESVEEEANEEAA